MGIYYSDKIKDTYNPSVTRSLSRYDTKKRLVNNQNQTFIRFIRQRDLAFDINQATVHVVTAIEAFRPDLIAYKYYGNTRYAWIILAANNIALPYKLVAGMKIIIPNVSQLQGSRGKLVTT